MKEQGKDSELSETPDKPTDQVPEAVQPDEEVSEQELKQTLEAHQKWLESDGKEGKRAPGRTLLAALHQGANLKGANLKQALLFWAHFPAGADLQGADLSEADLEEAHLSGAHLQGAQLTRANLQKATLGYANFERADLGEANLQKASLNNANLQRAALARANLEEADLKEANLQKAHLWGYSLATAVSAFVDQQDPNTFFGANLRRADLERANLKGANLRGVNLQGANLTFANLQEANLVAANLKEATLERAQLAGAYLDRASFLRANLTNAVLVGGLAKEEEAEHEPQDSSGTKHDIKEQETPKEKPTLPDPTVAATHFGMAVLIGAKLPPSLKEFRDSLRNVEETSRNARTIYFSVIALCAFALLTVATTTDAQLIIDTNRLKLPILNAEVSVVLFYISAPLLGFLVFVYLHMYLAHLWELAAQLPAIFPDGLPLRRKVYPWMLNLVIEHWQRPFELGAWFRFAHLRAWTAILLGWGLLPLTTGVIAYRFLVREDEILSNLLLALLTISTFFASLVYQRARATVRSEDVRWRWSIPVALTTLVLAGGLHLTKLGLEHRLLGTKPNIQLRAADLKGRAFGRVNLSRANLALAKLANADLTRVTSLQKANLRSADLTGADLNNVDLHEADLGGANLQEANLRGAKLRGANLRGAKLQEVDLGGANLRGADLWGANLQGTYLGGAKLQEVNLGGANVQEANLTAANLQEADLVDANLQKAYLVDANLQKAALRGVHLQKADLRGAELQKAKLWVANLQEANLFEAKLQEADLGGANLRGADLGFVNLQGAHLGSANVQGANLRGAKGVTTSQIKKANNWQLAFYSNDLLEELGLPADHNETVKKKLAEMEKEKEKITTNP